MSANNRFERHRKKTLLAIVVVALLVVELLCYLVVVAYGHREKRRNYPYDRVISGYTVYRQTPGYDFGDSTIRATPDLPAVKLDSNGFICDTPVNIEKPPGVVRVFLVGGSTAIGAGQTEAYSAAHPYPWGIYSYPESVGGQLKAWLGNEFPEAQFQVITSAAFGRRLHQSFLDYAANVSRFSPDFVISLEGMNDLSVFDSGTPYGDEEAELPKYIGLWNDHYEKTLIAKTNTYYVLKKVADRLRIGNMASSQYTQNVADKVDYSKQAYQRNRERYVENADRYLQVAEHFRAAVESDDAELLIALQPLLHRIGRNKPLSEIEKRLNQVVMSSSPDTQVLSHARQINCYFFDDYLCDRMRERWGDQFLDVNAGLVDVGAEVEFFTDYCHLTREGNRITASLLGQWVAARLESKTLSTPTRPSN
ncbi:SGNH/GDSL hydrolase family protein [Roseimaritima ulvae]|uniref:SGNH hydrolase-type esterase domain-containing protein n=1 Tax=Roseimaritima ulvae TaxID=980254 RepID=A0A5B9R6R4_9BACT|nr:SGNH/GDSL hydrolase family protein [Roseimaritima ulvae]QEG42023.1 hypothetical protein UC8_40520 [Roseimaritima ulvae]